MPQTSLMIRWSAITLTTLVLLLTVAGVVLAESDAVEPTADGEIKPPVIVDDLPGQDLPVEPQQAEQFPGEQQYKAALMAAERRYVQTINAARKDYVQAIRDLQMRASMMPQQSQAMDAEVKRIENLPAPRVISEPQAEAKDMKQIEVELQAPSPLWSIEIQEARQVGEEIWVLSKLNEAEGMGALMITTISDKKRVAAADLPVKHYVVGKTWGWENHITNITFIRSTKALGQKWQDGKPVKSGSAPGHQAGK